MDTPFNVKPEDLDPKVILPLHRLLPGIELLALVNILSTRIATPVPMPSHLVSTTKKDDMCGSKNVDVHGEGRHETDDLLRILGLLSPWDQGGIEVRGEVLVEDYDKTVSALDAERDKGIPSYLYVQTYFGVGRVGR